MRFGFLISTLLSLAKLGHTQVAPNNPVSQNFIKNGDFKLNSLYGVTWVITDVIPGWQSTNLEQGEGYLYNKRWAKGTIVVQLDSYQNDRIAQKIKLNPGTYVLEMDYAAREGFVKTSGMIVKWNSQVISNINASDQQLKKLSIPVQSNGGINVLQIIGSGPSDGSGMTISNVQLHSSSISSVNKEPYIWRVTGKSMLVNGDFQTPVPALTNDKAIISSLNGWKLGSKVEQGVGGIYNKKWGKKIVILMNGNKESSISQVIHLQKGLYRFELDYAGRASAKYSNLNIILNGEIITKIEGKDEQPRTYGVNIFMNEASDNTFQLSPESPTGSIGMTISGTYLFPIHRQIKFDKNEQCYKTE